MPCCHEIELCAAGGYLSFQPLWDWITEAEPDLFN